MKKTIHTMDAAQYQAPATEHFNITAADILCISGSTEDLVRDDDSANWF